MRVLFIRHGITDWNRQGKIQGWTDIPLSAEGRAQLADCALPEPWARAPCYTSTLVRTLETARLLGALAPRATPALREMCWGEWEGKTLEELRQSDPRGLADNERRGLDFRPAGGESPREVRTRLEQWLDGLPEVQRHIVVVTHKGVIRAALSLACGWDMRRKFSAGIDWRLGHEFSYTRARGLILEVLNLPLLQPRAGR